MIILAIANWRYTFHFQKGDRYLLSEKEDEGENYSLFSKSFRGKGRTSLGKLKDTMLTNNYES